jgi:hypothetical protein
MRPSGADRRADLVQQALDFGDYERVARSPDPRPGPGQQQYLVDGRNPTEQVLQSSGILGHVAISTQPRRAVNREIGLQRPSHREPMSTYDEDLKNLEDGIRRLKIEYDIFFGGNRKMPPDELRMRVERIVKRLAEAGDMTFSQRFLYNTLIARFYVYRDLWRRTQQEHESATGSVRVPPALKQTPTLDEQAQPAHREMQVSISDPATEEENVRQLYEGLLRMKGGHAKELPGISYRQFADYIANQTRGIKAKCQCSSVIFRISMEDQNVKFTAKAEKIP